jgi:hypothetical protein
LVLVVARREAADAVSVPVWAVLRRAAWEARASTARVLASVSVPRTVVAAVVAVVGAAVAAAPVPASTVAATTAAPAVKPRRRVVVLLKGPPGW